MSQVDAMLGSPSRSPMMKFADEAGIDGLLRIGGEVQDGGYSRGVGGGAG
jgi:hypothetical protein